MIAEQTEGKITGLLPPGAVSRLTRLVLASAVYLKAAWTQPFPESATADAPFYPDGQDRPGLTVPMMHLTAPQAYLRGDGYQAVLLPYRDIGLAMAVVLPDGPLSALRPKVAAAGLGGLLAGTARHQVTLSLPRFRLEAAFDLIPALRRLGVTEAFGDDADFSGITDAEPLRIGAVAHKAYIDVDEHGTEAAAATAVVMAALAAFRAPPPVTMVVDRPFLFAIIDTATSLPLFLGQVSHPHGDQGRVRPRPRAPGSGDSGTAPIWRQLSRAPGWSAVSWPARSCPAVIRPSRPSSARPSRMNTALVVACVIRVRTHCRQFQQRQVTPSSSRQITSPGSGCSITGCPSRMVSNGSSPAARASRAGPRYMARSSPPTGSRCLTEIAL